MSMNNKVPEIRFKGFSGEWDKEILGERIKLENGFAFQSKYFKKTPTEIIVLTPGSINIGGGFQAGKGQYYDEKKEVSSKYVFKPGDMFITMTDLTPTAQALGFPAIIPKDENTYLHNQRLGKLVGFNGDLAFLYSLLCTMKKQKEVVSTSSGTTVKHTSPDKFLNRIFLFPNKEEQTQIGNYFQKLDTLINQHQQKHDKLSNIKKAMLEKMFPKPGEIIPKIRIKGFSGEWKSKVLGSVSSFYKGKELPKSSIQEDSVYPCIHYGELFTKYSEVIEVVTSRTNQKDNFFSISNDVLMPTSDVTPKGLVKSCCVKQNGVVLGSDILVIRPNGQNVIDGAFLSRFIRTREQQVLQNVTGSTVFHLYASSIESLDIVFPSIKEQSAIINYFKKLDTLINQHQQQITKLNNIKQACLSKMFV